MHPNRGREWPIADIRRWVEDEHRTHRWVAEQIGTTDQRISILCRKHGIRVHRRGPRPGPGHTGWKGGRLSDGRYVLVWVENHPHARKRPDRRHPGGYVAEHRLVMETMIGRYLLPSEVVHHRNGDPSDNRPENLELFASNGEHLAHELAGRCPKWTEDGKARIVAAVRRRRSKAAPPESSQ